MPLFQGEGCPERKAAWNYEKIKKEKQPITQNLCPSADTGLIFDLIFFSRSGDISFTP
jgi:hypothetical protein